MRLALKLIATTLALAFSVQRIDGFGFALHSRKPMQELARRNYYHQCFHTQCSHCPSNIDRSSRKYQRTPSTQLAVGVANVDTSAVESLNSIISSSSLSSAVESDGNWNDLISFGGNPASFIYMAETEGWVKPVVTILDPTLNYLAFAMVRIFAIFWLVERRENLEAD